MQLAPAELSASHSSEKDVHHSDVLNPEIFCKIADDNFAKTATKLNADVMVMSASTMIDSVQTTALIE